jgi:hypothetical protein
MSPGPWNSQPVVELLIFPEFQVLGDQAEAARFSGYFRVRGQPGATRKWGEENG